MKNKNVFFKHGLRAVLVVLIAMCCYASISTVSAQSSITGQWAIEMKRSVASSERRRLEPRPASAAWAMHERY